LTTKALERQLDDEEYALSDSDYEDEMPKPAAKKAKKESAKRVLSVTKNLIFLHWRLNKQLQKLHQSQ